MTRMLSIGAPAPDFCLVADDGSEVRLSDFLGKRVVLFFYPRADTPGCTTEACEFNLHGQRFEDAGATILGISPDPVEAVRAFRRKFDLGYRLLADPDHAVSGDYGVWKLKKLYGREFWGVERSTFVVDEKG